MTNNLALTITLTDSDKVIFFLCSNGSPRQAWITDDKTKAASTVETFLSHGPNCDPEELGDRLMECTQGRRAKS